MAYIGTNPANTGTGLFSQDTFTGDGSTVAFDLTNAAPDGGGNELQVFVDNVRQQEGSSNAYTLGFDGSSELKRITFTAAPAASASIFVLNPGTKNVQQVSTVSDNAVTTAKVQDNAVTVAKLSSTLDLSSNTLTLPNDVVNADKIVDDAISEEHLDDTAITGHTELSASAASDDVLLIYDTSSSTIKKITANNVGLQAPTISSVSPSNVLSGDGTGNHTFTITGTGFLTDVTAKIVTDGGTDIAFNTVTRNSSTQLTCVVAKNTANLTDANEPFDVVVTTAGALSATSADAFTIDASPVYVTSAGTLGTLTGGSAMSTIDVVASDPESAGNVTYEIQSGSLPAGVATATVHENGVSKFRITGTPTNPVANTTSNFTLRAVDAASNTTSRAFSITVNRVFTSQSFTSSGTFAVPSGVTSLNAVMVVAGGGSGASEHGGTGTGGGGAGGLVFMPEYPVSPGGTVTVTVGCGGAGKPGPGSDGGGNAGQDSSFGSPGDPGFSPTSTVLTAKGGGAGGQYICGGEVRAGGSGGGASVADTGDSSPGSGGVATQPTQPGNSGAYGFGNNGGDGGNNPPASGGGGGGGAGAAGTAGQPGSSGQGGGPGGIGRAYTIADGTTPVYYAGGGGGNRSGGGCNGAGGQGGGTAGSTGGATCNATANRGGGTGAARGAYSSGNGGKGVVIVRY